jgi:hypothetical protein
MHLIALRQEQFCQIRAILPGDAGNQSFLGHSRLPAASGISIVEASLEPDSLEQGRRALKLARIAAITGGQ